MATDDAVILISAKNEASVQFQKVQTESAMMQRNIAKANVAAAKEALAIARNQQAMFVLDVQDKDAEGE